MGLSSSKSKTKTTSSSTPLDQYAPYINQGLSSAQNVFDANQGNLGQMSQNAYGLFNNLAGTINNPTGFVGGAQNAAANIYNGSGPGSATYARLQQANTNDPSAGLLARYAAGAEDPSIGALSALAQGSRSPGAYDGIGASNPALAALRGMTAQTANPLSAAYYGDVLSGKYLAAGNPYLTGMLQQSDDAVTRAANQRFAVSGMGAGLSTPYMDVLTRNLANSENSLRYQDYNSQLDRMTQVGAQADAGYNAAQDRSLSAASDLGNQYNASGQLQLGAQQARDAAYQSDRSAQLAAAQALGSQYMAGQHLGLDAAQALGSQYTADNNSALGAANGNSSAILQALGLTGGLADAQYAGVAPALQALSAAASIPYTGINNYAGLVNGLTGKYGNTASTEVKTSTSSLMDQLNQGLSLASSLFPGGQFANLLHVAGGKTAP